MRYPLQSSDNQGADAGDMIRRIPQGLVGISPFRLYGWGCCAGSAHGDQNLHGANGRFAVVGASDKGEAGQRG